MNTPVITARELAQRVASWPDYDGDAITVRFEYDCYLAAVKMTRCSERGPLILCACGGSCKALYRHPLGRGLRCAACCNKIRTAFEVREQRADERAQRQRRKRTAVREVAA